jgi:predicted alpha/beta superfamily hydrolase
MIQPARRLRGAGFAWDHEIQIALPASYFEAGQSYPVLWLTDGSQYFEQAVKMLDTQLKGKLPEMIVVAVGIPPEDASELQKRRVYELTANSQRGFSGFFGAALLEQRLSTEAPDMKRGNAAGFLKFLVDELRPVLARDYRMSNEHVLFGDSAGGSFCIYALLKRPEAFSRYVCGSPALYMGGFELFRMEERYAQMHRDLKAELFLGAGEAELTERDIVPAWGVVSSMARMAEILSQRNYPSLKLHVRVFPGETHGSAAALNLAHGLQAVWAGR